VQTLVVWRVLQGIGMGASVVCARAIVRDLYVPVQGMRVMSQALSGLGVLALASPIVGGLLAAGFGWRAALAAPAVFGALTLALLLWVLPETLPGRNLGALRWATLWENWRRIGRHRSFVAWGALVSCTYGGLYTFLASSSFVFIDVLGQSRSHYGFMLASSSVVYLVGTVLCRRWLLAFGPLGAVRRAAGFTFAGGALMAVAAALGSTSPWPYLAGQWAYALGHGIHQPCGQAAITGPFPANAGAASALAGFVMAAVAFGIGTWLGWAMDGSVRPMAYTQALFALLTSAVAWTWVQRYGQPSAA
jgi:MFS transporter, DHA1 family, multidrug resistance protein